MDILIKFLSSDIYDEINGYFSQKITQKLTIIFFLTCLFK